MGVYEAAVHTVRLLLNSMQVGSILVKLDFSNAFCKLSLVVVTLPELLPYCNAKLQYGRSSGEVLPGNL